MQTIFIQIASYRDTELPKTVADALTKAKHPDRLHFGICNQYGEETEHALDTYKGNENFSVKNIHWRDSRGLGLARYTCQEFYKDEDFSLQIDSHTRFVKDWDELIIQEWESCGYEKAVLTCHPAEFRYEDGKEIYLGYSPTMLVVKEFYQNLIPVFRGKPISKDRKKPYRVAFAAGGFIFARGTINREVKQYKEISFLEEMAYSLRLFTYGYRCFCPAAPHLYHLYLRSKLGAHHYWNDFTNDPELASQKVYENMQKINNDFQEVLFSGKNQALFGDESTLEDFQNYTGISFKEKVVHPAQHQALEPPYATDSRWINEVMLNKNVPIKISIDTSSYDMSLDYDFWYFGLHNDLGIEIVRDDIKRDNWNTPVIEIDKEYFLKQRPTKYVLWPHSKSKGWLERKEYELNLEILP